jgi:hypothetical protein
MVPMFNKHGNRSLPSVWCVDQLQFLAIERVEGIMDFDFRNTGSVPVYGSIFPPKAASTFDATACMLPAPRANGRTSAMSSGWLPRGGRSNSNRRIGTYSPTM